MNYFEQLISEWYQYKGYFVRENIRVGKRDKGGYAGELDIVAFHPETKHLVHLEPSTDANKWKDREVRYKKKFDLGRKYIPSLFKGLELPEKVDQRAIFLIGSKKVEMVGGGKVYLASDILSEIYEVLKDKRIYNAIVPENLPLIRTLHLWIDLRDKISTK